MEFRNCGQLYIAGWTNSAFTLLDKIYIKEIMSTCKSERIHQLDCQSKPGTHRKIAKDYRPKRGKDQEILSESGRNPLKIVLKLQFSNDI